MKSELIKGNLDIFISNVIEEQHKDIIFKDDNVIYQLTSSFNQNNNTNDNLSVINLGICETKLKLYYNISFNASLLILKMDIYKEGLLIPIIEYEVYNIETKEKLDLNICKDVKININIPVNIEENNLFKYNSSHEYYNDICYNYGTESKTDIIIKDRRNEFMNGNMSLCENNCNYNGYDNKSKKALCECNIKINFPLVSEIVINKDRLLSNFKDIKSTINMNIMKCYYTLFTIKGLIKNSGNYILGIFLLFTIILALLFKIRGFDTIKSYINQIIKKTSDKNEEEIINIKVKKKKKNKHKVNIMKTASDIIDKSSSVSNFKNSLKDVENKKNNKNISDINNYIKKEGNILTNNIILNEISINYNDYELNNLNYNDALILDKRTYTQYYFSLLKTKHIIIFTFYTKNDYNSRIIKIILFIFAISLYMTVNALFFNDATIHKIYEDQGKFDFIYQIPLILYSSIITNCINTIIKFLSLSEANIIQIKKEKGNIIEKSCNLLKCLVIKFIVFFILIFLFLILFWYYLSCFGAVYSNTQIHLLKDTLIGFGLSLMYPFALNLLPGIFRMPSLKDKNRKTLYILSKVIQLI